MNLGNMWKPAAIGGILLGVLSSLPVFNCACCIWIIGGGVLAAYLFVKESPEVVSLGKGVGLGLLAGVIGTIVYALFQIPLFLMSPEKSMGMAEQFQQMMERFPVFNEENRKSMMELVSREGFFTFFYVVSLVSQFLLNCLLAMLGGTLGVAIFEKRKPEDSVPRKPDDEPPGSLPPLPPNP